MRWLSLATIALVSAGCASMQSGPASAPQDGRAVLAQMHERYASKWFNTLTFVQKTTQRRPDGTDSVSTWYEAMLGTRLRIDMGDPSRGNGALYTPDSLYVVRGGKIARRVGTGNPFLPLIAGVFLQPLDLTVQQIAAYKVDLSLLRMQDWEGRPTYVIGSRSSSDLTSPQLWIDRERLIVMRFIMTLSAAPNAKPLDIRLEDNVPVGGGWLATKVRFLDNGVATQTEDYSDWKADVALSPAFFQAEHWSEGPHWAKP